ncbi:Twinkle protein, mitochondrial [Frankliniella fusca]|uniref:Twinkle protein, mitochondrial n=1 Tax=Frankliniella fusca TaxID=407009 RepID=A0AAE1HBZ5_9NEOP|nr:Twinkle protein, mitochondrial [Frankliniella fusca]
MEVPRRFLRAVARGKNGVRNFSKVVSTAPENVCTNDFKKVLLDMDMSYVDGFTCIQSECKLCSVKSPGNLYINKTTGFFTCVKCKNYGEWTSLQKLYFTAKKREFKKNDLFDLKSPLNGINPYPKELSLRETLYALDLKSDDEINKLLQQFHLPNASSTVLKQIGAHVDSTSTSLYFPFWSIDKVIAGYRVLAKDSGKETTLLGAGHSGLITFYPERLSSSKQSNKHTKAVRSAVLVISIVDAVALAKSGIKSHIICLPHGISMLPIEILPLLENYSKITFWFRNCIGIWDAIRCFSAKLNPKRCYAVKPNASIPSAMAAFENSENLVTIIADARPLHVEDVTSFKSLRAEVMSELSNIGKVEGIKWRCFPQLNNLLKGFRRGELTVLSGSTGSGKTTLMSQYSLDLAEQGVNTLWGSFEIPNHRLARTLLTQLAGIPLHEHMDRFDEYADKLETLPMYFMKFHGQHSLDKVMQVLEHAQYVYDIAHVIIDTVQFMMGVSEDSSGVDRFWRQDNIIAAFRSFATLHNCHVTLVIHPRKERPGEHLGLNSVFGGAKATQEADNVLMLQDYRESKGGLFLKILKNRFCGEVGRVPLEFNKESLRFTQQKVFSPGTVGNDSKDNSWRKLNVLG